MLYEFKKGSIAKEGVSNICSTSGNEANPSLAFLDISTMDCSVSSVKDFSQRFFPIWPTKFYKP